ncbi:ATP binding protein, putative [Ricinus communis]|uniref:Methyltransferase n=1 Tax=Ricinus communis TaxID=3988 RepID=B9S2S8_RICCO|nr:ATP binding protein, putative [Ricinus communis]|eukprot:XP_002520297.1 probable methyltransferase PMT10 [Ricinus communis]
MTTAMKPTIVAVTTSVDIMKTPSFVKMVALSLVSLSVIAFFYHLPSVPSLISTVTSSSIAPRPSAPSTTFPKPRVLQPPPWVKVMPRMGILDEKGAMTVEFEIGDVDESLMEEFRNLVGGREDGKKEENHEIIKYDKFKVCEETKREFIPCLDNVQEIARLNLTTSVKKFERHCPQDGNGLDCLIPMPEGYQRPIPWPKSRDEVWFSNVPHTRLVEDKGGQNWIALEGDKFIFPGGGTQFIHGADQYLDQISQMVPDIAFGENIRVALDIGCGVASFGAFLLQRNVTALSIAPKDVHENQIQSALERGAPAMVAVFASRRLLYPSQAFDMIHCSRCRIDWTSGDGIFLLEADRMLRAGGYFVWAAQPVYKHEDNLQEQWREMQNLTNSICWELVKKEGYIAIWRKPFNNSCYLNREAGAQPPLCDSNDDPDDVWYVDLRACITRLPEDGYGGNVTTWPTRLHYPPDRLQSIKMDATISRKELLKAESRYWNDIIESYVRAFHWKEKNFRNVLDMRAGFGGFAAAMHDLEVDCWVMNVVPVNGFNTLPVIYDRGLIGVMHDWCEPFDTYPRTYDLLHAVSLFSVEQNRHKCNFSTIMLEMDRMLRPGGTVYIRDIVSIMGELQEIASAMGWVSAVHDTAEGPHASRRILISEKRMP